MDPVATAKEAFAWLAEKPAKRDYQAFFDALADDVVFEVAIGCEGTPLSEPIRGKHRLAEFFTTTQRELCADHWLERPLDFLGGDEHVVVLGCEGYTIRSTGAVARHKEFAISVGYRDGLIAEITEVKDLSEFVDSYRHAGRRG